ncbi:DUF4097 family beta strand repeat-containing protein [Aureivirga marina]|uniref:hypothetical protein n=1 Tax=Aureivirga marina TaxID=1182451 RepID=UPI0018CA274B|nr:hypothetical protein [Aureivirga marina]
MKTSLKLTLLFFLCAQMVVFAQKYEKSDIIERKFNVSENNILDVTNSYGNITLNTWDKSEIYIKIIKTIKGDSEKRVNSYFKGISFDFDHRDNKVKAETVINNTGNWFSSGKISMQIDYIIQAPKSIIADLENEYGNILIGELNNNTKIQCAYGNVSAENLNGTLNKIKLEYSNGSTIDFVNELELHTDYSNISVEKANFINLNSDYSNIKIDEIKDIDFNIDYGNLVIKDLRIAKGNSEYTNLGIGNVNKSLNVVLSYGAIKVKNISKDFLNVNLRTEYSGVKLEFPEDISFAFDLFTEYANITELDKMILHENFKESYSHKLKGIYNASEANGLPTITVKSSYNAIRLKTK